MIDTSRIDGFDWDSGNSRKNADEYDVSQAETKSIFSKERKAYEQA